MDPFTCISLAGSIVAFVDFGLKIVSAAREMHSSASGATPENKDLESLTRKLKDLSVGLNCNKLSSQMTGDEISLNELAGEWVQLSQDLLWICSNNSSVQRRALYGRA